MGRVVNGVPEGVSAILDFLASVQGPEGPLAGTSTVPSTSTVAPSLSQLDASNGSSLLSRREREVLALIARGESNKQIARRLSLSLNTVNHHVSNIYAKIEAPNRAAATAHAIRHGLI
jgi:LuxR family maltose regulon positive regulatory protein